MMTTINFPIYDQLVNISKSYDNKLYTNNLLAKKLNNLEQSHKETVYLIIKIYMINNEKSSPLNIPYNGKVLSMVGQEQNIEFDLENLPKDLIKLLNIFIKEIIKKK